MTTAPTGNQAQPLISLTYLSTATSPFSTSDLTELLSVVRPKNQALGLTGMLLYADEHFIQTLEGPEDVVGATFRRIDRDNRHRNLFIALREPVETRAFPDWSMGFESISRDDASQLPGFNDYLAGRTMDAGQGRELGRAGIFHRIFRDKMR